MRYTINDLCVELGKSRTTIWRMVKKGAINPPDIGADGSCHPLWLTMPVKNQSNQTTNPSS